MLSKEDRDTNIAVIVAAVSPYRGVRDEVRREVGRFVEIYANCPLQVAEHRSIRASSG
jgi:adenylylsulfate kinase